MNNEENSFYFRIRVKELLEENNMTIQNFADQIKLPFLIVNRAIHPDLPLIEKEYVNAIINGFGLTYEEFFLPRKSRKQAKEVIGYLPQRLINFVGDEKNIEYIDLGAYFKASGYTSDVLIAHIVDHWYDFMSDDWFSKIHPLRKNPIKVPSGYKNKKSFIGEKGKRPGSYREWLSQY